MSRWDRYVLRPRVWTETSRSEPVPHIGPYTDPVEASDEPLGLDASHVPSSAGVMGSPPHHLGRARGPPPGPQAPWWHAPGGGRAQGAPRPLVSPWLPPSPIYCPRGRNPGRRTLFRGNPSVPPPPPFSDRGCLEKQPRHPAGRRSPLRETIHSHGRLPYVP